MTTISEAREFLRQGRVAEAERAYGRVLEATPDDAEALAIVGLAALREGRAAEARARLERATAIDPGNVSARHQLGRACEAGGDAVAAIAAFRTALAMKPDLYAARLDLARALERGGDAAAILHYARALQDAQVRGQWLDAATTPVGLRPAVERAVLAVRKERTEALANLIEPLAARYGAAAMRRVERCLRILLRYEAAEYPDGRQRPTFLYFPELPASPYLERRLFAWMDAVEALTPLIRGELAALLAADVVREPVFDSAELERANLRGAERPPSWTGFYFHRHGVRRAEECGRCPETAAALDLAPLCRVRGHGPEALFSVFTPGTHLLPHRGVTNTRLVAHLPLIVPRDCALRVGGELHAWREGSIVVFDDTYEHEAWNRSAETRVVLIMDVWNPHLTEVERLALTELIPAIGDFNQAVAAA